MSVKYKIHECTGRSNGQTGMAGLKSSEITPTAMTFAISIPKWG